MTGAMAAFGIAVSGSSLICYVLMTRMENRRANRRSSRDGSLPDSGNYSSGDGWNLSSWFGGDNSSFDNSGDPANSGGGDAGGGGDSGGGGDGGGD